MSGKANEHKEQKCSNANRIAYVTKDGILFILDVKTYKAVTCFKVEKKKKNKKKDKICLLSIRSFFTCFWYWFWILFYSRSSNCYSRTG